ncbi:hypothetical protein [Kitasatospora sp. GAS1066B]|uniref:hypothetical protein n=1 Tax=Kitasatospora sp. GAS1066B TaxID=3156271 RepID=UPI003515F88C
MIGLVRAGLPERAELVRSRRATFIEARSMLRDWARCSDESLADEAAEIAAVLTSLRHADVLATMVALARRGDGAARAVLGAELTAVIRMFDGRLATSAIPRQLSSSHSTDRADTTA